MAESKRSGGPQLQRLVKRGRSREVTRIGDEEPSELPIAKIWREVKKLYRLALHPAVALHIRHKGRVVMDRTLGHVSNPVGGVPGRIATPDTLFNLFSASKIVTSTLVHALAEDGLFSLDDRVADHLPGFARHGKGDVRITHLLNHTAGIPDMPPVPDLEAALRDGTVDLELLFDLPPQSRPGDRVAYHSITSWFLIQRIIEDATGKPLRQALRDRILDPLGFENLAYGVAAGRIDEVAKHVRTGPPIPPMIGGIFERSIGIGLDRAVELTNQADFLTATLPSANVIGTPREAARFMQLLLNGGELDGTRVISEDAIARMTGEVTRAQLDGTFGFPMRYGLGVMMGGNRFSLFGLGTRGAFGHLGLSNVVVYADPARELAVSFLNTGKPLLAPGMVQWYAVLQHIASRVPKSRRGRR